MKQNLLSVVIADDDHLVLKDLVHIIDWNALGFNIVGTATSGEQALKYIKKNQPDLLITDICMIGMNGLDLIEEAQKLYPKMKFLIISAYHEFDYARRAISRGVMDYILKTEITPATLTRKLTQIQEDFHKEIGNLDALRFRELEAFLQSENDTLEGYPYLRDIRKQQYFFVIIGSAQMFSRDINEAVETLTSRIESSVNLLVQIAKEHYARPIYCMWNHKLVLGLSADLVSGNQLYPLNEMFSRLRFITASTSMPYIIFYQEKKMTIEKFRKKIRYIEPLLLYHLLFYPEKPLALDTLEEQHYIALNRPFSFHSLIFDDEHEEEDMMLIKDYIHECCRNYDIYSIISFYRKFCTHMEISSNNTLLLPGTLHTQTPEHFLKWSFNTLHQCILYLTKGSSASYSPMVDAAIQYMMQNYSDLNLSASKIADSVGLSSNRLGVLFKQDTGSTVNEYLNNYRVKKAVELLEKTNMKIYEISEKCGYKSSQYFSQIIYQKTGKRPIDYRKAQRP